MHRRHQHRGDPRRQVVSCDDLAREVVVGAILDDELDLVVRLEPVEVAPVVPVRFAAGRAFDVDNLENGRRHAHRGTMAARLEHHGASGGQQPIHQRVDIFLQKRFPTRDLDQRRAERLDGGNDLIHGHLPSLVEGVGRVAPAAAQVAGGQPHEHAQLAGARRLALDRMENLVNRQHRRFLLSYRYDEADVLHEADVNDLQECQKFSGYGRHRGSSDRHQQGTAVA